MLQAKRSRPTIGAPFPPSNPRLLNGVPAPPTRLTARPPRLGARRAARPTRLSPRPRARAGHSAARDASLLLPTTPTHRIGTISPSTLRAERWSIMRHQRREAGKHMRRTTVVIRRVDDGGGREGCAAWSGVRGRSLTLATSGARTTAAARARKIDFGADGPPCGRFDRSGVAGCVWSEARSARSKRVRGRATHRCRRGPMRSNRRAECPRGRRRRRKLSLRAELRVSAAIYLELHTSTHKV